jgi:hypothetical protein
MELEPGKGLGPIKFGMSPKEVMTIMGDEQVYEPWMGGNLNDSLLYPGIIIRFDSCNSKGPLDNSKVEEFQIAESFSDVQFKGLNIFKKSQREIEELLTKHKMPYGSNEYCINLDSIGLEFGLNGDKNIDFVSLWISGVYTFQKAQTSQKPEQQSTAQLQSIDYLLDFLNTSEIGWPQYFRRLEVIEQLGNIADPKAILVLEDVVRQDTQEFDAWGLGVGFSMAYFAQKTIDKIKAINHMNPNMDVVAFFVRFFKDVPYHVGVVSAEFSRDENPSWEADWVRAKQIVKGRNLAKGEPIELVTVMGGQTLQEKTDEKAYLWLEKMIVDIDSHHN